MLTAVRFKKCEKSRNMTFAGAIELILHFVQFKK